MKAMHVSFFWKSSGLLIEGCGGGARLFTVPGFSDCQALTKSDELKKRRKNKIK
jgi:hypothetical protein